MALKQIRTITSNASISDGTFSGAFVEVSISDTMYIKVQRVICTKDYDFPIDLNGENFIAQAYKHIKTLPEFSGAIDC